MPNPVHIDEFANHIWNFRLPLETHNPICTNELSNHIANLNLQLQMLTPVRIDEPVHNCNYTSFKRSPQPIEKTFLQFKGQF